jgi:ParB-like nuclease family protein
MSYDSGSPRTDASYDFNRARRRQALTRLLALVRRHSGEVLRYEDVVAAAGYVDERDLGVQVIRLDTVVGTVDRSRDFDRAFRPLHGRSRARWERIAAAYRSGESLPPIHVRRVGDMHFVVDGHHRVSAARALGLDTLDARVIEVRTQLEPATSEFEIQTHERLFAERVPLPPEAHARLELKGEARWAALAEGVEAWGFRHMQERREFVDRREIARRWFNEFYEPTVELLREAGLVGSDGETEAFIRLETQRYMLLRSHAIADDAMLERLRREL